MELILPEPLLQVKSWLSSRLTDIGSQSLRMRLKQDTPCKNLASQYTLEDIYIYLGTFIEVKRSKSPTTCIQRQGQVRWKSRWSRSRRLAVACPRSSTRKKKAEGKIRGVVGIEGRCKYRLDNLLPTFLKTPRRCLVSVSPPSGSTRNPLTCAKSIHSHSIPRPYCKSI